MPKKYTHIKAKAIELRKKNMTITEIVERLKVPKTTVYGWIKDMPIPRTEKQSERQKIGTKASNAKYAKIREDAYQQGCEEAPELMKNPMFRDFVSLYMAEGAKRNRNKVDVANSDVAMIKLCHYWIKKLGKNKMGYFLQTHIDNDDDEVKQYWANALDIQPEQITIIRKSNSGNLSGRQWRSEHGVLSVSANDTHFHMRMQAWMDYLQKEWVYFAENTE